MQHEQHMRNSPMCNTATANIYIAAGDELLSTGPGSCAMDGEASQL